MELDAELDNEKSETQSVATNVSAESADTPELTNTSSDVYGRKADGTTILKPGRKPKLTPEERAEHRRVYQRQYYARLQKYKKEATARQTYERPFTVDIFDDRYRESYTYTLRTREDFIALIDTAMYTLIDKRIFSDYEMSSGKGSGERLKPIKRTY